MEFELLFQVGIGSFCSWVFFDVKSLLTDDFFVFDKTNFVRARKNFGTYARTGPHYISTFHFGGIGIAHIPNKYVHSGFVRYITCFFFLSVLVEFFGYFLWFAFGVFNRRILNDAFVFVVQEFEF